MRCSLITIGAAAILWAPISMAATLTYTDRAQWLGDVDTVVNYDTDGSLSPGQATNLYGTPGLVVSDLQVTQKNGLQRVYGTSTIASYYNWESGAVLRSSDNIVDPNPSDDITYDTIRLTFTAPVSALGFDFGVGGNSGVPGNITVIAHTSADDTVTANTTSLQQPTLGFFGLTSDSDTFAYVDIKLDDLNRYLVLDNISKAVFVASGNGEEEDPPPTEAETLEPGTFLQLLTGLGFVAMAGRRRLTALVRA